MTVDVRIESPPLVPPGLAAGYLPRVPALDEMVEPDGALRPHWRMFVSMLDDLGRPELTRRWEQARRIIRENGITHNVYGDPNGLDRPWNLDLIPLLMPAEQWRSIGQGLVQRARLLDRLLADLYGPAESIALGLLPAELAYANAGFLRPCHGIRPPGGRWLHLYAADIIRGADGRFAVLSDRTQVPSGAGYTLENRIVLSRVLPTAFRQCNVQRLASFFMTLRQTLVSLAPANRENPRVVLLTPGPYNETYFEHAYLARYLGYTLVQGNDLTVRDGKVYLKTLSGLQRVDVIFRRVDDDYCDPLELLGASFLGVPGLIESIREGNVAVANALGSGVLQAPAILSFLPRLCRHFLGEDLQIPSVPTWWCGDPQSLGFVLDRLDSLVIKPAYPTRGADPQFGSELSRDGRSELAARIRANPDRWVAQAQIETHNVPVLLSDAAHGLNVQSRRFVLRSYLVADGDSYDVMPGGLTRVTGSTDTLIVSLQQGGGSKDTWILGDGPVGDLTLLAPSSLPVELSRGGGDLPSRVADDLFWLGRYVQRAESQVRLTRAIFSRLTDPSVIESPHAIGSLIHALLHRQIRPTHDLRSDRELVAEVFNPTDRGGLRSTIRHVHALARVLRDRISADAWRILQTIERDVADFNGTLDDDQVPGVLELLNKLMLGFLAFGGVAAESMTRGQSWRFLDMGARLERSTAVARLVGLLVAETDPADESSLLDAVLEVADCALTYRRRYLTQLEPPAVVDLLLADETNPRALAFQVAAIEEHLRALPHAVPHLQRNPDLKAAMRLRSLIALADIQAGCATIGGVRSGLERLLKDVTDQLAAIADTVSQTYFSHATVSRRLIGPGEDRAG